MQGKCQKAVWREYYLLKVQRDCLGYPKTWDPGSFEEQSFALECPVKRSA